MYPKHSMSKNSGSRTAKDNSINMSANILRDIIWKAIQNCREITGRHYLNRGNINLSGEMPISLV